MSADGSIALPLRRKPLRIADLFCGAGGSSTGAIRAAKQLGLQVQLTAVNHWDVAIETHTRNHPEAVHHCADLEHVRPREAVPGGVLDLLIASPTCTYHSRARGGRPVHDQQRMDPWHVVRWVTDLRVHRLLVENVPEFLDWGPCNAQTGKPIKSRRGEYFRAWKAALEAVGFKLDWRVLCCADYGDPTTRERFFLIGRSDGKRLRWPDPTHSKGGGQDLLGSRQPWRGAREVIDWDMRGKSIFNRKKPLAPNTLRRLLAGAERYGWPAPHVAALRALLAGETPVLELPAGEASPFMVHLRGTSDSALTSTARDIDKPVPALTTGSHVGLVMATGSTGAARPTTEPVPTITTGGKAGFRPHFVEPFVFRANQGDGREGSQRGVSEPMPTVTCSESLALAQPLLAPYYGGGSGETAKPASEPLDTITTKARFGVAEAFVMRAGHGGDALKNPSAHVLKPDAPLPSQTGGGEFALAQPFLVPNFGEDGHQAPRTHDIEQPLPTITATGHIQLAEPVLMRASHGDSDGRDPGGRVLGISEPLPTLTAGGGDVSMAQAFILPATHHGDSRTRSVEEPLPTITAAHRGELAIGATAEGSRIDILYRMLHWRELARAMSFDDDGEIYDFAGNGTQITKQIGNAVPGRTSKALVLELISV